MSNLTLYPEDTERGFFWMFVYFHGRTEFACGGDLVRANRDLATVKDGVHAINICNRTGHHKANLFLWSYETGPGGAGIARKGVVVFADDAKATEYAQRHFDRKSKCL